VNTIHPMLNTAVKAARRAGGVINRATRNLDVLTVRTKGANDFVSEVDQEAERAIVETLRGAYPEHAILAEEGGATGRSEYVWIVDPLDGTTNFLHGFPQYAVSIALMHRGVLTQAVVYDPNRNDLFTASRGRGAFLNEHRIRVLRRARNENDGSFPSVPDQAGTLSPRRCRSVRGRCNRYSRECCRLRESGRSARRNGAGCCLERTPS
jgi:fructose-1,6-bisphosphatase/inositol monophosphatase family enzyme